MAIARDTISGIRTPGVSPTNFSFTMGTVSNGYLVAWILNESGDLVTGVTYNSVTMTQLAKVAVSTFELYAYGLANPTAGTHNITVTSSGGSTNDVMAVSYSGVSSTEPDAIITNGPTSTSGTFTTNLTTVAANCWTVLITQDVGANLTAGTGSHFLQNDSGTDGRNNGLYDSNGALAAGSNSMTVNMSATGTISTIMLSLAPAAATSAHLLATLGVGS